MSTPSLGLRDRSGGGGAADTHDAFSPPRRRLLLLWTAYTLHIDAIGDSATQHNRGDGPWAEVCRTAGKIRAQLATPSNRLDLTPWLIQACATLVCPAARWSRVQDPTSALGSARLGSRCRATSSVASSRAALRCDAGPTSSRHWAPEGASAATFAIANATHCRTEGILAWLLLARDQSTAAFRWFGECIWEALLEQ